MQRWSILVRPLTSDLAHSDPRQIRQPTVRSKNTKPSCIPSVSARGNRDFLGSFNQLGLEFLSEMGRRLSVIVGDRRETAILFQRLSVCIQRFNLIVFKGIFPTNPEDEA